MVLGSSMPAKGSRGKLTRCFNCGTYRRFSRLKCHANTVGWDRLDEAVDDLLETVKGRIDRLVADPLAALRDENWAKRMRTDEDCSTAIGEELDQAPREQQARDVRQPPESGQADSGNGVRGLQQDARGQDAGPAPGA